MTDNFLSKSSKILYTICLFALILTGILFRFYGANWNQDANLHPDEYGLTNTLTQLSFPKTVQDYFNTRISPLSPYHKYDQTGQFLSNGPDNRMRWGQWPIILIRGFAELTGNTGYNEIRIMGRILSAIFDALTVLLIFLIGRKLYGRRVGLLAAALSALAVMQIQQSHFMTVDNFAVFFSTLAMFAGVQIKQHPPVKRTDGGQTQHHQFDLAGLKWYVLFGVSFGMAIASKINLVPLGGMLLIAVFISIADLKLQHKNDINQIFQSVIFLVLITYIISLITFRICQPMSFRAATGDTSFFTLHFNQDWVDSMKVAQQESSGGGGGPPAEQWTDRPIIIFPLLNMVLWGMGLPLGLAAWSSFIAIGYRLFRYGDRWRVHLLPFVWVGGYFLFMATRWVKSMRYFLPIYPFLCLIAAWGLIKLFQSLYSYNGWRKEGKFLGDFRFVFAAIPMAMVLSGTLIWSIVFVKTIYQQEHTRIQATKWIFQNIPAPIHLQMNNNESIPIPVPDGQEIRIDMPFQQSFSPTVDGRLTAVTIPHIRFAGNGSFTMLLTISTDAAGEYVLEEIRIPIPSSTNERGLEINSEFQSAQLEAGQVYYLALSTEQPGTLQIFRNILTNEDWDEGLPFPFYGYDPFGQFYEGRTMNVRWMDDQNKRNMFYENLAEVDYIILPSQRAIWSASRLPLMYPMTLEYYRALFDGRLGFDLAVLFQAPFKFGPLRVSDVGGSMAWNQDPKLPLFNFNPLSAEEAFSVYDHPPVWIFAKNDNFSMDTVKSILGSIDLNQVQNQNPKDSKVIPIK
ncbi:MAG: hypothetical protein CL609_21800 [Anaerolineaceae bacterium]|nr:hypothetical protein [Anaerolineaceae bacterium]